MKNVSLIFWCIIPLFICGCAASETAKYDIVHGECRIVQVALERYRANTGRYPSTEEGLDILLASEDHGTRHAPYLKILPMDPWGNRYRYSCTNSVCQISSVGADSIFGTSDDVVVYMPPARTHNKGIGSARQD